MKRTKENEELNDRDLITGLHESSARERETTATLLECLAEVDRRGLAGEEGYPSLFVYCTDRLGFSEGAAFRCIRAARAALRFPVLLAMIRSGALPLASAATLAPFLTPANHADFLQRARGMSTCELQFMLAALGPVPSDADIDRDLPHSLLYDPGEADPDGPFDNIGLYA